VVPAEVDQIGDGTWALFPRDVFLKANEAYTARLAAGVCGFEGNCTKKPVSWSFRTSAVRGEGKGDASVRLGFALQDEQASAAPLVKRAQVEDAGLVVAFSEPVMNVTSRTLTVAEAGPQGCGAPLTGRLLPSAAGDTWTFSAASPLKADGSYCLQVSTAVYDLAGRNLSQPFTGVVSKREGTRRPEPQPDPQVLRSQRQRRTSN
jgi:hypothetical protein